LGYLISLLAIILDQVTKYAAVDYLKEIGSVKVIDGVLNFTYAENTGAAFSLFSGARWGFIVFTLVITAAMIVILQKKIVHHPVGRIGMYMVIGGAIGNFIDRLIFGYVVDMFEFTFVDFAIFNVADIFLTVGEVLIGIYIIFFITRKHSEGEKFECGEPDNTNDDVER